jgi:hypothetical protein
MFFSSTPSKKVQCLTNDSTTMAAIKPDISAN